MKSLRIILSLSLICVVVLWLIFEYLVHAPIVTQHDLYYLLNPGVNTSQVAQDLQQSTYLTHPLLFRLSARMRRLDGKLQAGEYIFPVGSSISTILHILSKGKVVSYNFTIVNGWTFRQVMTALKTAPYIQHTLANSTQEQIAEKLDIQQKNPEGWLFPETYRYVRNDTDLHLLQQAQKLMQKKLNAAWQSRDKNLWYHDPYQALIVASMIEKETAILLEKPLIAAVILKRLQQWMHLQIDATVIYGLGDRYRGKITIKDLQLKTPYNTYTKYGLPPTPICIPSESSIQAALHPGKTDVLYFVAKGDGTHVFSENLTRHDEQVDQYQLHKPAQPVKFKKASKMSKTKKEDNHE